jgi:glucose/arabinose dehydrogenase
MRRYLPIAQLGLLAFVVASLAACSSGSSSTTTSSTTNSTAPLSSSTTTLPRRGTNAPPTTAEVRSPTAADLDAVHIGLQPVVNGLDSPVDIAFRPGAPGTPGTMYVVEQGGGLRIVRDGHIAGTALDLSGNLSHGNEQGFLGATFSPDGSHLYVHYTDANGNTNVDEYRMRGDDADPGTRRRVFFTQQPYPNHNGGEVIFGPDGKLYIGLGDGGSEGDPHDYGQDLTTPLSKILRIDPAPAGNASYSVPKNNPFVSRRGAVRETWMWGLRNPWRFTFDRATGDVWIGDVGQNAHEEIDFARAGASGINWGWSAREGFHAYKGARPPGARDPIVEGAHSAGWCAIVGGYVYRGRAIPALDGVYLYGDNCRPSIEGLVQRDGHALAHRAMGVQVDQLTSFGEDDTGELYAAARGGTIYKIVRGS